MIRAAAALLLLLAVPGWSQASDTDDAGALVRTLRKDPDAGKRVRAAERLGALIPDAAVVPLAGALRDPDAAVRRAAALALGRYGAAAAEATEALTVATDDPQPHVRAAAEQALAQIRREIERGPSRSLFEAIYRNDVAVARRLARGGRDLDRVDDHGRTALHWAVRRSHPDLVELLLDAGADPTIRGRDGLRAWDDALESGDRRILALLEAAGGRFDPPAHPSEIRGHRVVHEGPAQLVFEVDYFYNGRFERAFLGAHALFEDRSTGHWGYRPSRLQPGEHCARVVLGLNQEAPDHSASDAVELTLYIGNGPAFLKKVVPFEKTWRRTDSPPKRWKSACGSP